MGKKRKMRSYPQKYGRKYANHPFQRAVNKLKGVIEKAEADGVVTPDEEVEIQEAAAVVEKLAEDLSVATENIEIEKTPEPLPEPVVVPPMEHIVETPAAVETAAKPIEKPSKKPVKKTAKKPTRKRTLKSKKDS